MMKLLKYLAVATSLAVLLFLCVANFSSVESRYECKGEVQLAEGMKSQILYIKIEEYRWWVGLWHKSNASMWVESPDKWVSYYDDILKTGDRLQIFDSENRLIGSFSMLSKKLSINTREGLFEGSAAIISK